MIRKIIVRLLLGFVALIGIVVLSGCIAGYLALQPPAFYADLRAQQITEGDQRAATAFFQLMERDLRLWVERSLIVQRGQLSESTTATAISDASLREYDPTQDTHSISITENQINAQLASDQVSVSREWRHPRIRIGQDRIDVAFEVVVSQASCVFSAELKPTLMPDGRLRLDLTTVRIGRLPLPLRTLLGWLPRDARHSRSDMELDLTGPTPAICVDLSDNDRESPSVKSIRCVEGAITIELLVPVLKRQQNERGPTPLALSGRG